MIDEKYVLGHRERALSPDRPVLRGSAQNPDVFFQAREASNPFLGPPLVQDATSRFAARTQKLSAVRLLGGPMPARHRHDETPRWPVEEVEYLLQEAEKVGFSWSGSSGRSPGAFVAALENNGNDRSSDRTKDLAVWASLSISTF